MTPETIADIQAAASAPIPFLYHDDRESPWLLARLLPGPARVPEIRRAPFGKLLDRPRVRPVVARCGRGLLDPRALVPAADPEAALAPGAPPLPGAAACAGLASALDMPLAEYSLTLAHWGSPEMPGQWRHEQMSRRGANLVLQLNFPPSHGAALDALLGPAARKLFECQHHPIARGVATVTMAWARIDLDLGDGEALIEELQSDWFRLARRWGQHQRKQTRRTRRKTPAGIYFDEVMPVYEAGWERVLLLAALWFLTARIGIRRIYLHRPASGARLKGIRFVLPPASLYTDLPRRFCFAPTNDAPVFLMRDRGKAIRNLRRSGRPVFWRLVL